MLTLVVGGQFGCEGKGKVSAYIAARRTPKFVGRGGGVNSSHTVYAATGERHRLRLIPTAATVSENARFVYGPGALLHIPTLFSEMQQLAIDPSRILIDPLAGVVSENCIARQREDSRYAQIGSTLTGTGYATASRAMRTLRLARDYGELKPFLAATGRLLFGSLRAGEEVLLEGHQGFGLSNYHGDYPFSSSRDCTAAALLSEFGIGPTRQMRVVVVIRLFPARNHPGRLPGEIQEAEASRRCISEYGGGSWGVGDRRRRIGLLSIPDVVDAVQANGATELAVTGCDYFDSNIQGARATTRLSARLRTEIQALEEATEVPVKYLSTGAGTFDMIEMPSGDDVTAEHATELGKLSSDLN